MLTLEFVFLDSYHKLLLRVLLEEFLLCAQYIIAYIQYAFADPLPASI